MVAHQVIKFGQKSRPHAEQRGWLQICTTFKAEHTHWIFQVKVAAFGEMALVSRAKFVITDQRFRDV